MNCIMKREMGVAGLFLIGFALNMDGAGETTVSWDEPPGVVPGTADDSL